MARAASCGQKLTVGNKRPNDDSDAEEDHYWNLNVCLADHEIATNSIFDSTSSCYWYFESSSIITNACNTVERKSVRVRSIVK